MSFHQRLQQRRKSLGFSRAELAKLLGVTASAVGNYETGVSMPKSEVLFRLFRALQCDANYLFQDDMGQASVLSREEEELLEQYRRLDPHGRRMVQVVLREEAGRKTLYTSVPVAAREGGSTLLVREDLDVDQIEYPGDDF